ncbi:MAG TPA: pilus assembly protein PilM, partial [Desulfatiglandales bacterium]|nr:pilus assembly protein PilM [Desulfatiglandales bacterium]
MLKLTKTSIGLDIGSHSIKLVELRHTTKGVFLTNFAVKELPSEQGAGVIAEKIKELFQEKNIKAKKVTLGISGAQVAIRHIRLPSMPKKELKEAVRWEAGKFISFPPDRAIVEYQLLDEVIEEGVKKLGLMVTAAERNFIENQLSVIKEAGLEAAGISTIPHALWHCMQMIPEANKGIVALIDI